jgi:class 3 adenylate cyclase
MLDAINARNAEFPETAMDLRIGINCGPVVAGVVGHKRFLYDLWGDSVNVASRFESGGVPGRIQVTKNVIEALPDGQFHFERRGMIEVKGIGEMEAFFLERMTSSHDTVTSAT